VFGLGKTKSVVGLDIGSSAVKAVELKAAGKGYRLAAFGTEPIPPDSIVDGAIIDGTAVAEAIRRLFENRAFKSKDVAASLSGNAVIVKKINLPAMTDAELAESIFWEAEQYIPFDIQDVNLDYQILNPGLGAGGTMDVLLVAAKKDMVLSFSDLIRDAGLTPFIVDNQVFGSRVDVQPTTAPSIVVSLTHVQALPSLSVGDTVTASVTRLGTLTDLSRVERQALARFTNDPGNHVLIEARPAANLALS